MSDDLDFYVRTATRGTVCGLGAGSLPTEWDLVLGGDCVDDVRKGRMRRDYGLLEASFLRREGEWQCTTVSVQVHRLVWAEDVVPRRLREEHGDFRTHVPFALLSARITEAGFGLEEVGDPSMKGFTAYRLSGTSSVLYVVRTPPGDGGPHQGDDVWSLALSFPR
ncbi:hypothetical protein SAMN06297387_1292 [Streptomyces zhaozhouensis]|uniref:Uncharacterized protein n=1 Tax=Streptomyces zhaozhouensis TaxID=1300267 RepID=A0A286E8C1_9ACTN|nr:hypothetical protein [Streptomyces zhaozhouensis]SOD67133.1 hypothetical protein SAMN06297387_1292 [Streptomyces zhaozhouensis]